MKLALGSLSWVLFPFVFFLFFLILSIFLKEILVSVCFFISIILLLLTGFFLIFFRDPKRDIGKAIVAPADGRIREIKNIVDEDIGKCMKISTFMNVYNVHVNRMPLDGVIKNITHHTGSYLPAYKKESDRNERVILTIKTDIGIIKIVQIAGTLARRIVSYVKEKDKVKKGDKIGIIKFGSRVDIFLPADKIKNITVNLNDRIKAGENTIAEIND